MKTWVLEQVVWAEKNLKGVRTGAEKRAAVVAKVDEMLVLPLRGADVTLMVTKKIHETPNQVDFIGSS